MTALETVSARAFVPAEIAAPAPYYRDESSYESLYGVKDEIKVKILDLLCSGHKVFKIQYNTMKSPKLIYNTRISVKYL